MSPSLDLHPLDHRSPIPLYHQLKTQIIAGVEGGDLPVGATLPPEVELVSVLGVSRQTVRRAMQELEYDGYIQRARGRGTTVLRTKISRGLTRLTSFSEDMLQRSQKVNSQLLAFEMLAAAPFLAEKLHLAPGTPVIYLHRLRCANSAPIAITTSYIHLPGGAGISRADIERLGSLYALLERQNAPVLEADRTIEAIAANDEQARLLAVAPGSPLLLVEGVAYTFDHVAIEYHQVISAGERYKYAIHVNR
ncbi:MAG: GntR family transcriptional regulator [Caldilineales bacterium]|nr:GntR family transcriptional regulator [Caldilineales bacterium]